MSKLLPFVCDKERHKITSSSPLDKINKQHVMDTFSLFDKCIGNFLKSFYAR